MLSAEYISVGTQFTTEGRDSALMSNLIVIETGRRERHSGRWKDFRRPSLSWYPCRNAITTVENLSRDTGRYEEARLRSKSNGCELAG
jgi:hypothetical protein